MAIQKLQLKFDALFNDQNFVSDFEQWLEARNVSQNSGKPFVRPCPLCNGSGKYIHGTDVSKYYEDEGNDS